MHSPFWSCAYASNSLCERYWSETGRLLQFLDKKKRSTRRNNAIHLQCQCLYYLSNNLALVSFLPLWQPVRQTMRRDEPFSARSKCAALWHHLVAMSILAAKKKRTNDIPCKCFHSFHSCSPDLAHSWNVVHLWYFQRRFSKSRLDQNKETMQMYRMFRDQCDIAKKVHHISAFFFFLWVCV